MIDVQDFYKKYDKTLAVAGLEFTVDAGEILGLIGPNGAGKTTTLRALAGVLPPSHGRLAVAGFDVSEEPIEAKRRLAYVPDDPPVFPDLTVNEHLAFTASVYEVREADNTAARLLEQFELGSKRETPARDLSRGMRQKLAICCAYLHNPRAILLDEPLTGLDPAGIRTLKETVVDRAGSGAAVIISSHLLAMVEDVCTHVLILNEGAAKFTGPITELRDRHASDASLEQIFFTACGLATTTT
ncbi:ABC transporter ATP-binding protein [Pirellulales bacterium]|nr:ABC transporter ATP-binding protein [Pirellulales bacterium]